MLFQPAAIAADLVVRVLKIAPYLKVEVSVSHAVDPLPDKYLALVAWNTNDPCARAGDDPISLHSLLTSSSCAGLARKTLDTLGGWKQDTRFAI